MVRLTLWLEFLVLFDTTYRCILYALCKENYEYLDGVNWINLDDRPRPHLHSVLYKGWPKRGDLVSNIEILDKLEAYQLAAYQHNINRRILEPVLAPRTFKYKRVRS
jgi:hypothetical protein